MHLVWKSAGLYGHGSVFNKVLPDRRSKWTMDWFRFIPTKVVGEVHELYITAKPMKHQSYTTEIET